MQLDKYITSSGESLLFIGNPKKDMLDHLAQGPGDIWHSSYDQGFKNCFPDLVYQSAVFWWFLNDFNLMNSGINWRVNAHNFVIRERVWNLIGGFDKDYSDDIIKGLDLGFNILGRINGVPMYVKGLFPNAKIDVTISRKNKYLFFLKNFKKHHSYYMMFRKGLLQFPKEYIAFKKAKKVVSTRSIEVIKPKILNEIEGNPTVSLVIPTMKRQAYTELLLRDHNQQSYLIKEAVIVDATPESERDTKYYKSENFKFDIKVKWQSSKGSCRARNEALELCTGDYIIFADDDVRVLPDFVENHIRLLQTYKASGCNGLDIMAENVNQDLSDLKVRLDQLGESRWKVGVSHLFSNANSCVRHDVVEQLIGNDINFDGGYGEDADFGMRILKAGEILLNNPFSPNLHLKPPQGGYRFWGNQSKILGKNRKAQPWELDNPVGLIRPIPSPTMSYKYMKHFSKDQIKEWRWKYFFIYVFKGKKSTTPLRLLKWPYRRLQFRRSLFYSKHLIKLGERYK